MTSDTQDKFQALIHEIGSYDADLADRVNEYLSWHDAKVVVPSDTRIVVFASKGEVFVGAYFSIHCSFMQDSCGSFLPVENVEYWAEISILGKSLRRAT